MSKIIGQTKLQAKLNGQPIPHFFILWGDRGAGKYLMSKQIARNNHYK